MLLAADSDLFRAVVSDAASHYGLEGALIERDYWLVSTMHAWASTVGDRDIERRYPDPSRSTSDQHVGRVAFAGGTSLSAAWGITQRWSQDIDLVLSPSEGAKPGHLRKACVQAFIESGRVIGAAHKVTDKGPAHVFAAFSRRDRGAISSIDVTYQQLDVAPLWSQRMPVMSMIGRISDAGLLEAHPELGGFAFDTLGPGTTAMNKLLAQTQTCLSGDMQFISERARDIYDLACIAESADLFEGHIGRDSKALLHIAEGWVEREDRKRPPDGFASLRSFDPSTEEYEALAAGYEVVLGTMAWGDKIPLDEAIQHAVQLDPGPAEPLPPDEPRHGVAYPIR